MLVLSARPRLPFPSSRPPACSVQAIFSSFIALLVCNITPRPFLLVLSFWILASASFVIQSPSGDQMAQGFTIPLIRARRDGAPFGAASLPSVRGNSEVPVSNSQDFAYIAHISVGGQKLGVILDTGSSDLWVVSSNCTGMDCSGVAKYNATASLSLSSFDFKLTYLIGTVSGAIGFDTVTLGPYQISSQVLALANETRGLNLSSAGNSGIMGLSFPLSAAIPATAGKTLLENLFSYFDDAHRFFAFQLGRHSDDSSFSLGKLDHAFANSTEILAYTPVYTGRRSSVDYWKLPLHAITLNSSTSITSLAPSRVSGSPTPIAVLDTGTTFILGPTNDVDAFWMAVGSSRKLDSGQWQVKCNRAVAVGFVLGDEHSKKEYLVDPEDINLAEGSPTEGWCLGGIQASDAVNSGDWILGDAFLRNVYVTHHGATSGRPPLIGLLNLTDSASALERFQRQRGEDPAAPIGEHPEVYSHNNSHIKLSSGAICGIVLVAAFVAGAVGTLLAQIYFQRRHGKDSKTVS